MAMEGKTLKKGKFLRREWKTVRERSTSGPGSEYDDGEELGDDEGWLMIPAVCLTLSQL